MNIQSQERKGEIEARRKKIKKKQVGSFFIIWRKELSLYNKRETFERIFILREFTFLIHASFCILLVGHGTLLGADLCDIFKISGSKLSAVKFSLVCDSFESVVLRPPYFSDRMTWEESV